MGNQFGWRATLRKGRDKRIERKIYLHVLSSLRQMYSSRQRTLGHRKKHRDYPDMCPSGGLAAALPSNFIVKLINKTKFYTEKALLWFKCTYLAQAIP